MTSSGQGRDKTSIARLVMEARQQFGQGKVDRAETTLQRALALNPRELQTLVALGIVAAETGRGELAMSRFGEALSIDPNCVPALCWMSFLVAATGRFDESRALAERSIALAPGHDASHAALGQCYLRQESYAAAIPHYRKAVALSPNNPAHLYALAESLLALRMDREAAEALRSAVVLAPEPLALIKLAQLELGLGDVDAAEKCCRRGLKAQPTLPHAHVLMGRILTEKLRLDEAEEHWKKAAELDSSAGFGSLDRALALAAIGRFDDAMTELNHSIELNPRQGAAYQHLAFAKRIVPDDLPLVKQMEELLEDPTLTKSELLNLLYALGKSFDNLGEYERAIGFFDRANALKRELMTTGPFDRAAFKADIDAKIKLFSANGFAQSKHLGSSSSLPILIVGMMRSGTTLAEQMLSCHPMVGGAGEQRYWAENDETMVDYSTGAIDRTRLLRCAKEYVELLTSNAPGFAHVIDKNPANLLVLGSFHLAFPNARIIYTRRNAIDTALSIWMTPMSTTAAFIGDRGDIVFAYKQCLRLLDHWLEAIPSDRFLEVRYEDLVEDTEAQARRIVSFCDLEWDEACLHPESNQRRVKTPSFWQVRQPVYKSSTERWRRYEPWLGAFEELRDV